MTKIYESPDGGKTVYERESGDYNSRKLVSKLKRITDYNKILPVLEVYRCVQSEGSRFGRPTIAVRTTGCTHRCYFGEGGWCDSWYTSIHPEKGTFTFNDIIKMYDDNPQVKEMMLTGGSPTMHPALVNEITHFAKERGIFVTIETEGSHFLETDYPLDLISLSPKFSNSVPVLGAITPNGAEENLAEIEAFRLEMKIPKNKTFIMPAGDTREQLIKMYPLVFEMVAEHGYNMTGRDHIIAYNTERGV